MKIAIIGGGFTGLSCAYSLLERKIDVALFENDECLGGLAGGFRQADWKWDLEFFYHHIFTNDRDIMRLAEKSDWKVKISSPLTTSFVNGVETQLDSPSSLMRFNKMSIGGRLRMGAGLAVLKFIPDGLFLEKYLVVKFLPKLIGEEGYKLVWEKLLKAKFGPFYDRVNMAWFWTRVAKRTKKLGYFDGGFVKLAEMIGEKIERMGGRLNMNTNIEKIEAIGEKWSVDGQIFDGVVITNPAPVAKKMLGGIKIDLHKIDYLWGQTLIIELEKKLIKGYWMNILENDWPFLVAVEHTNMIDKSRYGNKEILYLGNYLADNNSQLSMSKNEIIKLYTPFLKKINPRFERKWIKDSSLFRKPFAQPVFPVNYSDQLLKPKTKYKGLYFANMSMVYPFDRGTNYAVRMGEDVAKQIQLDLE
jgi:protoporphyrinogen oxidase